MDTLRSVADAINRSNEIIRPYLRKVIPKEIFIPDFARFKMKIYFKNGKQTPPYWSLDYVHQADGQTVRDEWSGLIKLIRLAEKKIKSNNQIKSIVIWANDSERTPETKKSDYSLQVYCRTYMNCKSAENLQFSRHGHMILTPKN